MTPWVQLFHRGQPTGSGILLTMKLVVTAYHCIRDIPGPGLSVSVDGGAAVPAEIKDVAQTSDLALLEISKPTIGVRTLLPARGSRGDGWFAPCRPSVSDPELTGTVAQGALEFQCQAGGIISAVQLTTASDLSNYHGYSGGPVIRDPEHAFLGVLIEQYLDRLRPERATNTLFAASVEEVIERFQVLSSRYLIRLLIDDRIDAGVPGSDEGLEEPVSSSTESSQKRQFLVDQALSAEDELEPNFVSMLVIRLSKRAVDGI